MINRKTDSFLDWLGDFGGLVEGLFFIGAILIENYSAYALESKLAWLLVRFVPSSNQNNFKLKKADDAKYKEVKFVERYGDKPWDPRRKQLLNNLVHDFNLD